MAAIVEQVKGMINPIKAGVALPTASLKEDDPMAGSVNLSTLKGKSKELLEYDSRPIF